ncbi:chemotaxis protein CheW [Holophaga foetida]|uniref:chemotaxis protein CheW n=1 Tax=Holophaga foetida TaxID=35839 RepID=UPI0002472A57|nr:chemotaxis protein CheW [Holophaga foetida]
MMTQYATFTLNDRIFGIEIQLVREIIKAFEITPVPRATKHIRGLINLRGQVVTIMDLGVRLGSPPKEITSQSNIIILKTTATSNDILGLLVDSIADVVEEDAASAEPPPANVTDSGNRFLAGVINGRTGLIVLLKLEDILNES